MPSLLYGSRQDSFILFFSGNVFWFLGNRPRYFVSLSLATLQREHRTDACVLPEELDPSFVGSRSDFASLWETSCTLNQIRLYQELCPNNACVLNQVYVFVAQAFSLSFTCFPSWMLNSGVHFFLHLSFHCGCAFLVALNLGCRGKLVNLNPQPIGPWKSDVLACISPFLLLSWVVLVSRHCTATQFCGECLPSVPKRLGFQTSNV